MATPALAPKLNKGLTVTLRSLGIDEAYIEKFIQSDPSVLGLGDDLSVIDKQRAQHKAGRLDLLLQDGSQEHRYEVELMLGSVDESHLIRAIEYWDIERRTYPAYEHCAVLVAEDVTARFLNVITLFSGSIPIIALQMNAIKLEDKTALTFLRVVDSRKLRRDDSTSNSVKSSDRTEWITYAGTALIDLVDKCLKFINEAAKQPRNLNYNKQFIGLMQNGRANNFVHFSPGKSSVWINIDIDPEEPWIKRLEDAGLDYRSDYALRVKVSPKSFAENEALFREMLQEAVAQDEK